MQRKGEEMPELTAEDRGLIEAVEKGFRPDPMDPARQAAFRRQIEERLEPRVWILWKPALGVAATAVAAAVLWISFSSTPVTEVAAPRKSPVSQSEEPAAQALLEPDDYGEEAVAPEDYLPDEYVMLASYFEVESADL